MPPVQPVQREEEDRGRLLIPVESSRTACAGAATAYLMRRVAARAGTYAPGIQEHLFFQLARRPVGTSLGSVASWFHGHGRTLTDLGYNILIRLLSLPTDEVLAWVESGNGYRAAVLAVDGRTLHDARHTEGDAVGITLHDATSGITGPLACEPGGIVMADPWPGVDTFARPPATLDSAHLRQKYGTLQLFWSGYG